jgi:hypothetical protein
VESIEENRRKKESWRTVREIGQERAKQTDICTEWKREIGNKRL